MLELRCEPIIGLEMFASAEIPKINAAWQELRGTDTLFLESLEDVNSEYGGVWYLGEFNGYLIFMSSYKATITACGLKNIDGLEFRHLNAVLLMAYKDGKMSNLEDIYENGELSFIQLNTIYERHIECTCYLHPEGMANDSGSNMIYVPEVELPKPTADIEETLKSATFEKYAKHFLDTSDTNDVHIINYFGEYGGAHLFDFRLTDTRIGRRGTPLSCETVGGETFMYVCDYNIHVYADEKLYTLSEAYENGLIGENELKMIKKYNRARYPFALESYIGTDLVDTIKKG
ncbi:MAG: hypothetical protein E7592_04825 [Ruminococcaceae bacterium]|nr:hypothetical protein [Oscillospiraceae bacterium]